MTSLRSLTLVLPQILDIPDKLLPIIKDFDKYRYFLIEGGRGGGKSQAISRLILFLAEKYHLRIVCGRETQASISESVYSLMADLIRMHALTYEVFQSKINHKDSESQINFRGFREQGAFNIQGMEGIDITWIDEAQAITKQTLDVLIPTIRKDNAKIFFTMNRHVVDDPVFDMFYGRDDCLHIHLDYFDNKFCTKALIHEAEECKKKDMGDYNHIWLGHPLDKSEDSVYTHSELEGSKTADYPMRTGYGARVAAFDIARYGDDKCACVILQQMGALHWEEVFLDEWGQRDLNYTTGRILSIINEHKADTSVIDEDGIGSGPLDILQQGRGMENVIGFRNPAISYQNNKDYGNNRTVNAYKLKQMLMDGHIKLNTDSMLKELSQLKYKYDNYQRKILISKQVMRDKYKIKSPNMADAVIMAVSQVGAVKRKQDVQYYNHKQESPEGNLFSIAGIR